MPSQPAQHDITLNTIRMHCLRYPGGAPPLLLLHSLSGNGRIFDGLVAAGLTPAFELLVPDMRGRGKTEAPLAGYSLDNGCADILALLDHFALAQVAVCGHSFGALQGLYFAAHHPQRVSHLIMLDAAAEMHPATPFMLAVAAARLDKVFPSLGIYRELVKRAPFVNRWYEEMNGFVAADLVRIAPTGLLTSSSRSFIATLAGLHICRDLRLKSAGPAISAFCGQN
jgi:pimeloyl-ACP methyl ester carboxylesterase